MIIKKFAFGNEHESFIESRFKKNVNIIYSDDNNKGKTLVIQGIMYALGNEAIFPKGFDSDTYYFYLKVDFSGKTVEFLRKGKTIVIKTNDTFQMCSTISEFKYLIKNYISEIPSIEKKETTRIIAPAVFYEIFFIGQDKRDTSNIFTKGYYTKVDFINMIYAMSGVHKSELSPLDITDLKNEIKIKSKKLKKINSEIKQFGISPDVESFTLENSDRDKFKKDEKILKDIISKISLLQRSRNRETNRKYKLLDLLSELNSLNKSITEGDILCAECGSEKIIFKNKELNFEVSNNYIRKEIIKSINKSIILKEEIIEEVSKDINNLQDKLNSRIERIPPKLRDIIIFDGELNNAESISKEAKDIQSELADLREKLKSNKEVNLKDKQKQKEILGGIIKKMNKVYRKIDSTGNLEITDLFTKKGETYSGSEEQEFYFCKLISLRSYLKHTYPLIVDSFRDGEISTDKENSMLDVFKKIPNQVILTSTLKKEEYSTNKYTTSKKLNVIDYSSNIDSKILGNNFKIEFDQIIKSFNVSLTN